MPTFTEAEIRASLLELLETYNLTVKTFLELGETEQLSEIDPNLDFAFRAIVPSLRDLIDS